MADNETPRERLLLRVEEMRSGPIKDGPIEFGEIAFLVHGISVATAAMRKATADLTRLHNLGPRGTNILNLMRTGVNQPHEIATALVIGRSLVSAELARLTEAGLILASQHEQDGRRSDLTLTPLGEAVNTELRAIFTQTIIGKLGHYAPEQLRLFGRMLNDMQETGHDNPEHKPAMEKIDAAR